MSDFDGKIEFEKFPPAYRLMIKYTELQDRIDKAIESLNYYIEGMNESLEIWNIVKENEKIEVDMVFQMLEREKQNYIDLLDILKGSDKDDNNSNSN